MNNKFQNFKFLESHDFNFKLFTTLFITMNDYVSQIANVSQKLKSLFPLQN
jgi:hypothetical protein